LFPDKTLSTKVTPVDPVVPEIVLAFLSIATFGLKVTQLKSSLDKSVSYSDNISSVYVSSN